MAKRFFYVSAGVFLLALAFHLGQLTAHARSAQAIEGGNIESTQANTFPRATACVNRILRWMDESGGSPHVFPPVPVPGTDPIVSTDPYQTVLLENGDWLKFDGTQWVLIGNLVGGPTPSQPTTFGALKVKYRK
ncbi:MAG: hypothetical protein HYR73_01070 [Candidatus Eisenbacteria bacterium]|nr:hypothetical protein [Candidatus Eisenbacteria bacterium]